MCGVKKEQELFYGPGDQACARVCTCEHVVCHGVHAEVRRQIVEVVSLLPPCGFWGLNLGCQSWQ